ncbi:Uncharacterised protein [uncultured archaeon]|nr:Uncharacterised protein [uncultured archaeon]
MGMRKGQIAMEYLATYGWALFAMFAVVALLVASGMLGAGRYQSEECTFAPNLPCNNVYFEKDTTDATNTRLMAHINITNTQGFPMYITDCNYTLVGGNRLSQQGHDPFCDRGALVRQGESFQYDIDCTDAHNCLTSNTPMHAGEVRTVYVVYTFKNCQDAPGADETAIVNSCWLDNAGHPFHVTSGKIVATVRER